MYATYFGLKREPFSIAPDPRYLFMSERHREALAHLLYGVNAGGGFVLLTGEIGAGKTTVCRCFLEQIPRRCNVAYIFNPKLTVTELLKSICDEFHVPCAHQGQGTATIKDFIDPLNEFLLKTHGVGQNNVLIIDEAQNLSADVLEQLRLLTNLETSERKLLQIILIGQPELRGMLTRPELEQLAQRVIARFHLDALSAEETRQYIQHRLTVAGLKGALPFTAKAVTRIHKLARGIPRRINLLCDRALLGAFVEGVATVDERIVDKAAAEVFGEDSPAATPARSGTRWSPWAWGALTGAGVAALTGLAIVSTRQPEASSLPAPTASATPAASHPITAASASTQHQSPHPASAAQIQATWMTDEQAAWQSLADFWQLEAGHGTPCARAAAKGIQCYKSRGGLSQLRQLDRPAILYLEAGPHQSGYAILIGLSSADATLLVNGEARKVTLATLSLLWRGEFATMWRSPSGYRNKITPGDSGPSVDWLATQLAKVHGSTSPTTPGQRYDQAMQRQVIDFQVSQGLQPDGVVGATTFMALNHVVGINEPSLATSPASSR